MKIAFVTFGCKVNTSEDEAFAADFALKGWQISKPDAADVVVINTCAVTETAAKRCASYMVGLKKKHPKLKIIAAGCLASERGITLKEKGADIVVTNGSKSSLAKHIEDLSHGLLSADESPFFGGGPAIKATKPEREQLTGEFSEHLAKTRAFFKIQDGCDANCAYCIIPKLRGKPKSKPFDEAVKEFQGLLRMGFKEIVLVGIHIGMYGRGEGYGLKDLLKAISSFDEDYRIRLSSVEVGEVTQELIDLMAERADKICSHLHIPLQSGSDVILKKMGRQSLSQDYIDACLAAKERIEGLTVGSDVIVGFPGERDEDFNDTIAALEKARADFIHVFPYSDRSGTVASLMEGKLSQKEKEQRASHLRQLWQEKTHNAMMQMIGKRCRVLTEKDGKGHASNYMRVSLNEKVPANTFVDVEITGVSDLLLLGEVRNFSHS